MIGGRSGLFAWIAAVLFGGLAPALFFVAVESDMRLLPYAFAFTLAHALAFGLPVALLFRWRGWTSLGATVMAAFLIGGLPIGIATLPVGVPSLPGLQSYLEFVGLLAALGAVGGLVFWLTLRWCDPAEWKHPVRAQYSSLVLAAVAVLASAAVIAMPTMMAP
jgi:hypothetical protein